MTLTPELLLALLGLYVLWAWPYRNYRIDRTRSELFTLRHRLFMLAAEGHLDYDAEAYRAVERLLNALIQHAHQMSLVRLLVMRTFMGVPPEEDKVENVYQAVDAHEDPYVQQELQAVLANAGLICLVQLAMSFLPSWLFVQAVVHIKTWRRWLRRTAPKRFATQIRLLEDEALAG